MTVTMSEHNKRLVRRALQEIYAKGIRDDLGLLAQLGLLAAGEQPEAG
jgi:hypothetical protein